MRKIAKIIIILLPLTFPSMATAQEEDFQRIFDEFVRANEREFSDFRDRANEEYSEFLRKGWEWFHGNKPIQRPDREPIVPPQPEQGQEEIYDREIEYEGKIQRDVPSPVPVPVEPIKEVPTSSERHVRFSKYGTECEVRLDVDRKPELRGKDENSVADFWDSMSSLSKDGNFLYDLEKLRTGRSLCDWALYKFAEAFSIEVYPDDIDAARLFNAYLMTQLGFKLKVGYSDKDGHLHLLMAMNEDIYDYCYWEVEDTHYFLMDDSDVEDMKMIPQDFKSSVPMNLHILGDNSFVEDFSEERRFAPKDCGFGSEVTFASNLNLLSFYEEYPDVASDFSWRFYANTPLDRSVRESLYPHFNKLLAGRTELQAAEMILNFVQTAFEYKLDDEVWGKDRTFFAEESLYYPYCDCEDRSVLFSHLIRDLLGLDVALVYSPGHLFAAVHFNQEIDGAYVMIEDRKFIICEPTCTTGEQVGWSSIEDQSNFELSLLSKIEYDEEYRAGLYPTPHKSLIPFSSGGKWGYKNLAGEIVVPCKYDSVSDYEQGDRALYAAEKDGLYDLFYPDGVGAAGGLLKYIPIDVQEMMIGSWCRGDYCAVVKYDDGWYFINTIFGWMPQDLCLNHYEMDEVNYNDHVYSYPSEIGSFRHFMILRRKGEDKYGVIQLYGPVEVIPFEYDMIRFAEGDKSKVVVYKSGVEKEVISLL